MNEMNHETEVVETKVGIVEKMKEFIHSDTAKKVGIGILGVGAAIAAVLGLKTIVDSSADEELYQPDEPVEVTDEDIMSVVE